MQTHGEKATEGGRGMIWFTILRIRLYCGRHLEVRAGLWPVGEARISAYILFRGWGTPYFMFFFICSALFSVQGNWCLRYTTGNRTCNADMVQVMTYRVADTGWVLDRRS